MAQIEIDPVTRIEGHGRVVINVDDSGSVEDASFQVVEFRGFEKFCEGRMVWDMPSITSRICGFCPVSHHLASVKATEDLLGVDPPPTAKMLRELLHMGQIIQSHALHFFFCAMPDFLERKGDDYKRGVFGMLNSHKDIADKAIALRKVGQDIVDTVGGGRLHPVTCLPGGMTNGLQYFERISLHQNLLKGVKFARYAVKLADEIAERNRDFFDSFSSFPSKYMGLTNDGAFEMYDGRIAVVDDVGENVLDFAAQDYLEHIGESADVGTWTKTTFLRDGGPDAGFYRVAPLARLNVAKRFTTPYAQEAFEKYKAVQDGPVMQPILFAHYARMIELLYATERALELLKNPQILSEEVRIPVKRRGGEGVGVIEAPRGTLFHHYVANDEGRIEKVNLVVSTAHNKIAMDKSVTDVARNIVKNGDVLEDKLNQVEMAIRCYDPCLSCSTHAYGKMPLKIDIVNRAGDIQHTLWHGAK